MAKPNGTLQLEYLQLPPRRRGPWDLLKAQVPLAAVLAGFAVLAGLAWNARGLLSDLQVQIARVEQKLDGHLEGHPARTATASAAPAPAPTTP